MCSYKLPIIPSSQFGISSENSISFKDSRYCIVSARYRPVITLLKEHNYPISAESVTFNTPLQSIWSLSSPYIKSHMDWTLWQWEIRAVTRVRQDEWIVRWWWGEGGTTSHRGPGSRDHVSDVYQQSVHGGSLATLTITAQHLGLPHTGNLRSFPPFHGMQTHSCCQPRAPIS